MRRIRPAPGELGVKTGQRAKYRHPVKRDHFLAELELPHAHKVSHFVRSEQWRRHDSAVRRVGPSNRVDIESDLEGSPRFGLGIWASSAIEAYQ